MKTTNRILINLGVAIALAIPMLTIGGKTHFLSLPIVELFENVTYDLRQLALASQGTQEKSEHVAIIDLDAPTIEQHGSLPLHNDVIAQLVTNLRDIHKAKVIVLLYPLSTESARQSELVFERMIATFSYDFALESAVRKIKEEFDTDEKLRRGLDGNYVIIPYELFHTERNISTLPSSATFDNLGGPTADMRVRLGTSSLTTFSGFAGNPRQFTNVAAGSGFVSYTTDDDGITRRIQMLGNYTGEPYTSLLIEALRETENRPVKLPALAYLTEDSTAFESIRIGDDVIPVAPDGSMLINFKTLDNGESVIPYFSALNILNENARPIPGLRDKIVIVGSSATAVNDLLLTPVKNNVPRVELYALAMANILEGDVLKVPHDAWQLEAVMLIGLGLLLSFIMPRLSPLFSIALVLAVGFVIYYWNFSVAWAQNGEVYRIGPSIIMLGVMLFLNIMVGFLIEWNSKRHVQGVLGQYLPPALANKLSESKKNFSMEGEVRDMSILFSDVRGFTGISEKFAPRDLTKFMNEMLTVLSEVIHNNNGTIDKYIGDAVMAFWNAPLDDDKHAINSVHAALGMQQAMKKLSADLVSRGLPALNMGIGINSGNACVGNMGSSIRMAYTVMGDTVNLSARLEGITKHYGTPILVSESTYEQSKASVLYRPVDAVRVKGKEHAVQIYEVIGNKQYVSDTDKRRTRFSIDAWEAYCNRSFTEMHKILDEAIQEFPEDRVLALFNEHCTKLLASPPDDDWEPVTKFDTK